VFLQAVEQSRGGAVDRISGAGLEGDVHRQDDIVDLTGETARGEHFQQRGLEHRVEIIAGPGGVSASPGNAQDILRGDSSLFAIGIA